MELDEFKLAIKTIPTSDNVLLHANEVIIAGMQKTSVSIINKIKKSIQVEILLCVFFLMAAIYMYLYYQPFYIKAISVFIIMVCLLFIFYVVVLYKKINYYETVTPTIREGLVQITHIIDRFVILYFRFTVIMLPVIYVFGLLVGYIDVNNIRNIKAFNWSRAIIYYSCFFGVWSMIIYIFSTWYIKKMYSNYVMQLKQHLTELDNE